ncbi:hypothetical protein [Azospirillum sp. A29]|uniref:hypothetical protein n=1 Tax=unclassified Azospirillum TaxID=2630922 RepID=UPI00366D8C79
MIADHAGQAPAAAGVAMMPVAHLEELIRQRRLVLAVGSYPINPSQAETISAEDTGLLIGASTIGGGLTGAIPIATKETTHNLLRIGSSVAEPHLLTSLQTAKTCLDELAARAGLTIEIAGMFYRSSDCYLHVALDAQRLTVIAYPQVPPARGCSN